MPQSFTANYVHCVFSTKERRDLIPKSLQPRLCAYFFGIAKNIGLHIIAVGGTANHIHLLIRLNPTMLLAEAIQKLKANSSRWVSEQGILFEWQRGYGAFSVSPSQIPIVKNYIRNQERHHKKRNFQQEFDLLLLRSGIMQNPKTTVIQ